MLSRWTSVVATVVLLCVALPDALSQSNYASQANDVAYTGEGLPDSATLDGKVTKLDDLSSVIFLNRTKATLNCGAGSMQVELKFNEPFFGIAYADFDRNSACQVAGKGGISYNLELPLKGCGTKQVGRKCCHILVRVLRKHCVGTSSHYSVTCEQLVRDFRNCSVMKLVLCVPVSLKSESLFLRQLRANVR
jgi:hypothetical protein